MTLSNKAIQSLAEVLAPEVIDYIHEDERYAEFLMEIIPDAIQDKLGPISEELMNELPMCVMNRIAFRKVSY
jgi:hypothetical protein